MVEWHTKSKRKISGGIRHSVKRCTKKKAWRGGEAANTKVVTDKESREVKHGVGNTKKVRVTATKYANLVDGEKTSKVEIVAVKENGANRLFARSNTGTKGALITVKVGSAEKTAKITNRPGQDGVINAVIAE